MNGTIIKGIGGFYYVSAEDQNLYECKARGIFRKQNIKPMIGDKVSIEQGSISEIFPRRTHLLRPPVANIDRLVIVAAAASPEPNLFLLDKMFVNAHKNGILPALCINKTDLEDPSMLRSIYQQAGYPVYEVCAKTGNGLEDLNQFLEKCTTAFAGLSGVGKSSILNRITDARMETGQVSDKIQRGRHTTRHVELMPLGDCSFVLDTPGFSSLEVTDLPVQELEDCFPELQPYKNKCRFRGCAHISEPDCPVRDAVEQGKIAPSRYESYKMLYESLKQIKTWEK